MGVLSDVIIARPEEAPLITGADGHHGKRWVTLESKGIDTVKLGILSQILSGKPIDDIDTVASFMLSAIVHKASEDGPWVYRIPDDLVATIAALDHTRAEQVATQWGASEEFRLSRWSQNIVSEYLRDLIAHARHAHTESKSLLLWISL